MNTRSRSRNLRGKRDRHGIALITTLAAVVVMTLLISAFFMQSLLNARIAYSSINQMKTDALAQSVVDIVIGELREEMRSKSDRYDASGVSGGPTPPFTYEPTGGLASNLISQKVLDTSETSLATTDVNYSHVSAFLKRSRNGLPMYTGGRVLGSSIDTQDTSLNGREIDQSHWYGTAGGPRLGRGPTGSDTGTNTPNWVIMTRSGVLETGWNNNLRYIDGTNRDNQNAAIGRFAFMIYNTGGLLDANSVAAPHDDDSWAGDFTELNKEFEATSSTLFLDLDALNTAGTLVDSSFSIQDVRESFVERRWGSNNLGFGTLADASMGSDEPGRFVQYLNEFAQNYSLSKVRTNGTTSDQVFLSRKDFLAWADRIDQSALDEDAPRFFTVNKKLKQSPSFRWPTTATGNLPTSNTTNIPLTQEKMASPGTALDNFSWEAGDSVVTRRFPLDRIDLIRFDRDSSDTEGNEIHKYFGLRRSSDDDSWDYCSPDSTSRTDSIKTLDQVAALGREPDFFELLKAVIHKDSLGVRGSPEVGATAGPGVVTNANYTFITPGAGMVDKIEDLQILRIGANIIDQWDEDDYPTSIIMDHDFGASYGNIAITAYGIENLPYISEIVFYNSSPFWPNDHPSDVMQREVDYWAAPEVVMPHQPRLTTTTDTPAYVSFHFTGENNLQSRDAAFNTAANGFPFFNRFQRNTGSSTDTTGFARLGSGSFSNYYPDPEMLGNGIGASDVSGAWDAIDFITNPTYGVRYQNPINAAPRIDSSAPLPYTGYSLDNAYIHYMGGNVLADESGFNCVATYLNHNGNYKVYNVFAGGVADPNGNRGVYDLFGLGGTSSLSIWQGGWETNATDFSKNYFPTHPDVARDILAHQNVGGTLLSNGSNGPFERAQLRLQGRGNYSIYKNDPRSSRLSLGSRYWTENVDQHARDGTETYGTGPNSRAPLPGTINVFSIETSSGWPGHDPDSTNRFLYFPVGFSENRQLATTAGNNRETYTSFYFDNYNATNVQSGRVRPADGALLGTVTDGSAKSIRVADSISRKDEAFPIILNRKFTSVAELGYVFRDMPHKTIDFWSSESVDKGLLDAFCLTTRESKNPPTEKIDLNSASPDVIASILTGAYRTEHGNTPSDYNVNAADASTVASLVTAGAPFNTIANVVDALGADVRSSPTVTVNSVRDGGTYTWPAIVPEREAYVRALSGATDASSTWNLLVDVVVQTGRYGLTSSALDDFVVEGEKRYWVEVSIDRYTGALLNYQLTPIKD